MWWKKFLTYILNLLKESTTYLAFFNFLACLGVTIQPELKTIIQNLCISVDALIVFLVAPYLKNRFKNNLYINMRNNLELLEIELSTEKRQSRHLKDKIQSVKTIQQLRNMQKELE